MPRLALRVASSAALVACASLPPPLLHGALAAGAGTLFEATPFVLAGAFARGTRLRTWGSLFSCGCGSLPGALGLPAIALCWLAFGPALALGRLAAALAAMRLTRHGAAAAASFDALGELSAIGTWGFGAGLLGEALRAGLVPATHPALSAAAGALLGLAFPCAASAVAFAAGLHGSDAPAAWGILATAGIVRVARRAPVPAARARPARAAFIALAAVCAALAVRGGAGFVNPRLVPLVAGGALAAAFCATRRFETRARFAWLVPGALAAALALGSPEPRYEAGMTALAGAFPGERIRFSGFVQQRAGRSELVRFAISCCRADASPIGLRTVRALPVASGRWLEADGTVVSSDDGPALRVERWRRIPRPADPFLYR